MKEDEKDILLESKISWRSCLIVRKYKEAARQLKTITKNYSEDALKLSAVFCVHGFIEREFKDHEEERINELIENIDSSLKENISKKKWFLVISSG